MASNAKRGGPLDSNCSRPWHGDRLSSEGEAAFGEFAYVGEPGERVDGVKLGGLDQAGDDRPVVAAVVGAGEQGVLTVEPDGPDGPLDDVAVHLDAAFLKEHRQTGPARGGIADGIGQLALGADQREPGGEQSERRVDDRFAPVLARGAAGLGVLAADLVLDGVQRIDHLQRLGRRW